ncbi:MAG: glycosyltransferase family 4 protein [Acidobacteriaceae bacterium]|nr:glycosyltransferase family 4 protein [Acidobacteriaceae bacterium]
MRVISLLAPLRCGVYQFHCNLVRGLAQYGCSVTWLCSGSFYANQVGAGADGAEHSDGEVVAPETDKFADRTRALVEYVRDISPDVLVCHARGDPTDFNAIRYFPCSIPKILVLHGSTLAVYRSASVVRDYMSATIAISPRIKQDLLSGYGFNEDRIRLLPHGVDTGSFFNHSLSENRAGPLRILSHCRIDRNKGVFWLPEILVELDRHSKDWNCTISGDGPDLAELKRRVRESGLSRRIQFTGWTPSQDVPQLMNRHDVFLFPTTYEGSPIALLEAMAGGCVPVVSRLPGITDWIVQDSDNGLLFSIGNVRQAAQHLLGLLSDRLRLAELRKRAQTGVSKYSLDLMTEQYYQLFCNVLSNPMQTKPPESLDKCELASGLKPAWWYRLPDPIKNHLRVLREKIHTSVRVP